MVVSLKNVSAVPGFRPLVTAGCWLSAARGRKELVCGIVEEEHLPAGLLHPGKTSSQPPPPPDYLKNKRRVAERISELNQQELGPRKIAKIMKAEGFAIEYYQVAYRLKNHKK